MQDNWGPKHVEVAVRGEEQRQLVPELLKPVDRGTELLAHRVELLLDRRGIRPVRQVACVLPEDAIWAQHWTTISIQ